MNISEYKEGKMSNKRFGQVGILVNVNKNHNCSKYPSCWGLHEIYIFLTWEIKSRMHLLYQFYLFIHFSLHI